MPPSEFFSQALFANGLFNPDTLPQGIIDPEGNPAPKRYSVYKNNVIVSYLEALGAAYPACKNLVGEKFFNALGREFIIQNPPNSQLMILFGAGFDTFLSAYQPAQQVPFLADIAKIERAWRVAYHSADIDPMAATDIGAIPAEELGDATVEFLPSVVAVQSPFAIFSLWHAAMTGQPLTDINPAKAEAALITRPEIEVLVHPIPILYAELINQLRQGATLNQVAQTGLETDEFFDFSNFFGLLIQTATIANIHYQK